MANPTVKIDVESRSAETNLKRLSDQVEDLNKKFDGFRDKIRQISLTALIGQAVAFADSVKDLSDATELSIGSVVGFSRAFQESGGSIEGAQKSLLKLSASIGEAKDAANESRKAFYEIGINLSDLRNLSQEDILRKTIQGLAGVEDVNKRIILQRQLLGKEGGIVSAAGLAQGFQPAANESQKFGGAINAASDAMGKLEYAVNQFKLQVLDAIKPITEFIASLNPRTIEAFVKSIVDIGQALVILFVAVKAAQGLRFLVDTFRLLNGGAVATTGVLKDAAVGMKYFGQAVDLQSAAVVKSYTGFGIFGQTIKSIAGGVIRVAPLVGSLYAGFELLNGALRATTGTDTSTYFNGLASEIERIANRLVPDLVTALNRVGRRLGMAPSPAEQREIDQAAKNHLANLKEEQDEYDEANRKLARRLQLQHDINKETEKLKQSLQFQGEDYARSLSQSEARFNLETKMVGKGENQAELARTRLQLTEQQDEQLRNILRKEEELGLELSLLKAHEEERRDAIHDQLRLLGQQKAVIETIGENRINAVLDALGRLQAARDALARTGLQQKFNEDLERQRVNYEQLNQEVRRQSDNLANDLQFQTRKMQMSEDELELAQALRTETDRYLSQREENDRKIRDTNISIRAELEKQSFLTGADLTASEYRLRLLNEEITSLQNLGKEYLVIHQRNGDIIKVNIAQQQTLRAEEKIRSDNMAILNNQLDQQGKISDSLTGSFRAYKDAIRDINDEITKKTLTPYQQRLYDLETQLNRNRDAAIQSFAAQFDGIDATSEQMAAFSRGMDQINRQFDEIGEKQRENLKLSYTWEEGWTQAINKYVDASKNASSQAQTAFTTATRGMEDAFVNFAQTGKLSFKDMANAIIADLVRIAVQKGIAGFMSGGFNFFGGGSEMAGAAVLGLPGFASGGYLPSGQTGIVGENGPELITGPANIEPMNSRPQVTNINYSISAVDAQSFKQLVARDPQFIYNVTEAGRRSTPSRRLS